MSDFKPGDRVVRVNEPFGAVEVGNVYTVQDVGGDSISLEEITGRYTMRNFAPAPAAPAQVVGESDPTGRDQHQPGAKLDAGKLRPSLVLGGFAHALKAVVKVGTDGANKYTDNGWREVPNGFARYSDAKCRHALAFDTGETHDKDTGSLHLAHEAWNALARLELYLQANPGERV